MICEYTRKGPVFRTLSPEGYGKTKRGEFMSEAEAYPRATEAIAFFEYQIRATSAHTKSWVFIDYFYLQRDVMRVDWFNEWQTYVHFMFENSSILRDVITQRGYDRGLTHTFSRSPVRGRLTAKG